jgi:hypothetical protein
MIVNEVLIRVIETSPGKHSVDCEIIDNDSTMKTTGLLLYKLKQIELDLVSRIWDDGGVGYTIEE